MEDPKSWMTKWLTGGTEHPDEKTRVMSPKQKRFYLTYSFLASPKGMDIPFYQEIVEIDQRLMMSYLGRRSDDVRDSIIAMEEAKHRNMGLEPLRAYMKERGGDGQSGPSNG